MQALYYLTLANLNTTHSNSQWARASAKRITKQNVDVQLGKKVIKRGHLSPRMQVY